MSGRRWDGTWRLAAAGVRAHRAGAAGTALVLALAGALLGATGILLESGLRAGTADPVDGGGLVVTLAGSFGGTACGIVVMVVAATVSLALRGRRRELALLRTVGATRGQVRGLVARETSLLALMSTPVGAVAAVLAAPLLRRLVVQADLAPQGFVVTVSPLPAVAATAVGFGVALAAGALGTREVLRVAPAAAVGASAAERTELGRARRVTALTLAVAGLLVACSPLVLPGTAGSAAAASSVLLLVGAAALGGPVVVGAVLGTRAPRPRRPEPRAPGARPPGAGRWLARVAARGFARRLTMVVIPLALVVAFGTAQTSTDLAVARASTEVLASGLHADLVSEVPAGESPGAAAAQTARVSRLPGVRASAASLATTVAVRTDDDPGALAWETTGLRAFSLTAFRGLVDPDVTSGSLSALAGTGTVAVSRDAILGTGTGVGDQVVMRFAGGREARLRVVAVYERGLGFGDYLTSDATARAYAPGTSVDAVLVGADGGRAGTVARELRALGLTVDAPSSYAATQASAGEGQRRLSEWLLLALLAFVVVSAADALLLVTLRRRDEVVLLRRMGATRRQLLSASCWEALLVAGAAGLVGMLAAAPAVVGVGYGLLGTLVPVVDWRTAVALLATVLVVAFVGTVPATLRNAGGRVAR